VWNRPCKHTPCSSSSSNSSSSRRSGKTLYKQTLLPINRARPRQLTLWRQQWQHRGGNYGCCLAQPTSDMVNHRTTADTQHTVIYIVQLDGDMLAL
jgi:hypothetical protein